MTVQLQDQRTAGTGSRSRLYATLAQGFQCPSDALHRRLGSGEFLGRVQADVGGLPYRLQWSGELGRGLQLSLDDLQAEYTALFDIGGRHGPPCTLYEGEHGGGRMQVIEETLRFYHHFGFGLCQAQGKRDRPDHLATELEFMHVLSYRECEELANGRSVDGYRRAQRDFLRGHLVDFLAAVAAGIASRDVPLYPGLAGLALEFSRQDLASLQGSS